MPSIKGMYYCCYYNAEDKPYIHAYATLGEALAHFLSELTSFADGPLTWTEICEAREEGFYQKDDKSFVAWGRFDEYGVIDRLEKQANKDN
jgi:hypothetical protein